MTDASRPNQLKLRFALPERFILAAPDKGKGNGNEKDGRSGVGGNVFDLAYAITCHKAQGSEWPVVILLLDSSPGARRICSREWLYTALSRASQLCITIGRLGTAEVMTRRPSLAQRKTLLAQLIREED